MTEPGEQAVRIRRSAGWIRLSGRALIAITGDDRVRWLDGMLTQDVTGLAPGEGCYAALLTHQGRIVGDMHVLARADAFWLELAEAAAPAVCESLEKHVIADDVAIVDIGGATERIAIEGPRAFDLFGALGPDARVGPEPGSWAEIRIADVPVSVFRVDVTGGPGLRCIVPSGQSDAVVGALSQASAEGGLDAREAEPDALEILRIETGTPSFGAELDSSVLPAEARLDAAISRTKGCYMGQEVVARMESHGRSSHLLVGVRFESPPPAAGTKVFLGEKRVGELTSRCISPHAGPIGLAFVRSAHAIAGTEVRVGDAPATVSALPMVGPHAADPAR